MHRRPALPLGLLLGMAACDAAPAPPSPIAVRDSAGVEIVENPGNPWEGEERWRLSEEPTVHIGAIDGAADYLFDGVTGVAPLGDGRIVVANGGDQSLRWYDPEGRFLFRRGGPGEGPGEFSRLGNITLAPGDTIVAVDWAARRFTLFGPDGETGPTRQIQGLTAPPGAMYRVSDGTWVIGATGMSTTQFSGALEPGRYRLEAPLLRLSPEAEGIDTLGMFPGTEIEIRHMGQGVSFGAATFPKQLSYAVANDQVYVGTADVFAVDIHSPEGTLLRSIRVPEVDVRFTPELEAGYRESLQARIDRAPGDNRAAVERELSERVLPDSLPAYSTLFVDDEENLWVGEHRMDASTPQRYAVFDPEGRFLTVVAVPPRLRVLAIRGGHLWGRATDELGVQYVVGHAVDRE